VPHSSTSQNTTTLLHCFPNRVPWNPWVGQDIVWGSVRNHRTNIQVFKTLQKIITILPNSTRILSSNWPYWCKELPVYFVFVFMGSGSSGYKKLFYSFLHGKSLGNTA
jgi:hypothetical protein